MAQTRLEKKLVEEGYSSFTLEEKNMFLQELARRGAVPANQITDEFILNYHKEIKNTIFRSICQRNIREGFTASNGHTYRTDYDDQINFMGKMVHLVSDPTITSVHWKTEDVGYISHTKMEWINVFNEAIRHKEYNLYKYNNLKFQVEGAETHEQIIEITWNGFVIPEEGDIIPLDRDGIGKTKI